jgi:hypothetical protein
MLSKSMLQCTNGVGSNPADDCSIDLLSIIYKKYLEYSLVSFQNPVL